MSDDIYNGVTLDEAAYRYGGYVAYYPGKKLIMAYDLRELSRYCREKGVEPIDLSEDELKVFEINPPLVYPRTEEPFEECKESDENQPVDEVHAGIIAVR